MRIAILTALLLVTSLALGATLAAKPDDPGSQSGQGGQGGPGENATDGKTRKEAVHDATQGQAHRDQSFQNLSASQRDRGLAKAESHGLFAKLSYDAGTGNVMGRFVSLHLAQATGAVHNVASLDSAGNATFLAGVTPDAYTADSAAVTGAVLKVSGAPVNLTVHNNPTAQLHWKASGNVTLTFDLAAGATASTLSAREVRIDADGRHGHILTNAADGLSLMASKVTVELAPGDSAMFRAHPSKGGETLHTENALFASGRLGAQLRVADADGEPLEEGEDHDVAIHATDIRKGRVEVEVESSQPDGRVVAVTVDADTLAAAAVADLEVTLDGTPMPMAGAVLTPGTFQATPTDGSVTVLVDVPHFSTYRIAMTQASVAGATPTGTTPAGTDPQGTSGGDEGSPGLGAWALVALLGTLAAVATRRR